MTWELLQVYGVADSSCSRVVAPSPAGDEELALWHTAEYIDAVRRLSRGDRHILPGRYRFGIIDNPVFARMFESESLKAGASLLATRLVWERQADVAFNFSGGMHHAMAGYASGFCVFNDAAIAVRWLADRGQRVVYVDIDAHHGDGVQAAFDHTDQVMTISLHESGEFLFPGSGFVREIGRGAGCGYSINVPLMPGTSDEVYLWVFERVVLPRIADFAPDVLVTQLGIDAHWDDPLAHLRLTGAAFEYMLRAFRALSLPWVALGGGGYNVQTVARLWSMAYGIMSDQPLADCPPACWNGRYGIERLSDLRRPPLSPAELTATREYAEKQVAELEKLLSELQS